MSELVEGGRAAVAAHDWPRAFTLLRNADLAGELEPRAAARRPCRPGPQEPELVRATEEVF